MLQLGTLYLKSCFIINRLNTAKGFLAAAILHDPAPAVLLENRWHLLTALLIRLYATTQ
jgi:hypothetical protein